ncbi:MAG: MFS transporter [Nocardioidaceae bacterium]
MARARSQVLRHRNFRLLVAGATVGALGNAITPIALAFAVLDLGGSATELGLVEAAFAACQVLTTLFGGVLGDRIPRQIVMEGSALVSSLVTAGLATTVITEIATIPSLAALGAASGVISALNQPSSMAMTRLVVPEEELPRAVAVRSMLRISASTAGFALGGILVAAVGSGWAIGVDALTYLLSAIAYAFMRVPQELTQSDASLLNDLGEGFHEVMRHDWLWFLILQALLYHLFYGGAQAVLGPIVVGDEFDRQSWGLSLASLMSGFLIGSLVCLRWRPRRSLAAGVLLLSMTGLFPLAIALSSTLWVVLAGAFLHGFGLQVFDVFWETAINQQVSPDKLSRVYAFDIVGSFVARPIGLALTGPVATAVGFQSWLVVVAIVVSGSSLIALSFGGIRNLRTPGAAM